MKTIINLVILPPVKFIVFSCVLLPLALWTFFAGKEEAIDKVFDYVINFKIK